MSESLNALRGSIEKWEKIRDKEGADEGMDDCPLCQLYCNRDGDCINCPVYKQTGRTGCLNTPYEKWDNHLAMCHHDEWHKWARKAICPTCIAIADDEVNFLNQLYTKLEKEEPCPPTPKS